jgi:hypothetical protein
MSKKLVRFFTRTHWNITDLIWIVLILCFFAWALYPIYDNLIDPNTTNKYITSSPHD